MTIILRDLPKYSLNQLYAGKHWSKRKKMKDNYFSIIKSQFKGQLSKDKSYMVDYTFYFKGNPLDASNCAGMVKLIEDVIFEDDKYDIIESVTMRSLKDKDERVIIEILET